MRFFIMLFLALSLTACESNHYYSMLETFGIQKRDVLTDKVLAATEAQIEARAEFQVALDALEELSRYDGETLEDAYKKIEKQYQASEQAANNVTESIDAMEDVSQNLFDEWDDELNLYTNSGLKRESERKFKEAKLSYQQMISAMTKAEKKMTPVIETLRDNMLYLKHNLNKEALSTLEVELSDLKIDVGRVIRDMNSAIDESGNFIDSLNQRQRDRRG